ncbi:MAG: DMT family transporter, partial [Geobacteraceae bacterium]|nr:DMT family transporter [Geobacteraceae bacterium]
MKYCIPILLMACAGAAVALQPSINARLAQKVGLLESACISFGVGTAALLLALLLSGRGTLKGIWETVWWEWSGGVLGAFFVTVTILAVPRVGTAAAMAAAITAQLLTGLVLDHFGPFGFRGGEISMTRTLGAALLILGAWL